jgi:uncharacterized membrane protein YdcZ (DUF606 family)
MDAPIAAAMLIRRPSAFLPLAMSLAGLALVLLHVAAAGAGPEADEGIVARLWWLLIGGQLPVVVVFALTYLPQALRPALLVLALQAAAVMANLAAVRLLNL